jgi:hypothetical protein
MRHRLSIIGYWETPPAPDMPGRGWPDPRALKGEWSGDDRRAVVQYLGRGKAFRIFPGTANCRICRRDLGSRELTDGAWAWPEGLAHYVEIHGLRMPEDFVATARAAAPLPDWVNALTPEAWVQSGPESMVPVSSDADRSWVVDDGAWLDWAAANTPARPAGDAASIEEVRELCRRFAHTAWSPAVDEVMGRWRVHIGGESKIYLQKCSLDLVERRLTAMRPPDPASLLEPERLAEIAEEYDGDWGAARVVAWQKTVWFVWIKPADAEWPPEETIAETLKVPQQFGWAMWHPGGGKSMVVPAGDETYWRALLGAERDKARGTTKREPVQRGLLGRLWSALTKTR